MHSETHTRSLVKTIVWRVIASCVTLAMLYIVTGKAVLSLEATGLAALVSMAAYYLHERIWNTISWGRNEA